MSFWENFWDIFWWFFLVYAFIAFLWALFAVIGDLFRDDTLSGWWKAVWIIFLIFAPFLSALIYVIARGRGMAERHQAAMGGGRDTDTYVPPPIMTIPNPADQIASAQKLLDQGAINQAEFDQLKQKALA